MIHTAILCQQNVERSINYGYFRRMTTLYRDNSDGNWGETWEFTVYETKIRANYITWSYIRCVQGTPCHNNIAMYCSEMQGFVFILMETGRNFISSSYKKYNDLNLNFVYNMNGCWKKKFDILKNRLSLILLVLKRI